MKFETPSIDIAIFAPLLLLNSEHPPVLALLDLQVLVSLSSNLLPHSSMMPRLHPLPTSSLQVENRVLVAPGGRPLLGRGGGEGDTLAGGGGGGQGGRGGPGPALDQQLLLLVLRVDVNHSPTLLQLEDKISRYFPCCTISSLTQNVCDLHPNVNISQGSFQPLADLPF